MNARQFLIRGLIAGLLAGFAAFAVAYVVGEPSVNAAISIEESAHVDDGATGHSHAAGETEVPRSLQSTVGLLTGTVVAGTTLGGLLGVLAALALGRFGSASPRATTLGLVAAGFVATYLVPFLAYPPNPPAVGSGDTIGMRSTLYFVLVAISIIAGVTAVLVGRRAAARIGSWYAALAAGAAYLLVMAVVIAIVPSSNEVPAGFPATVLYAFRQASVLTQLALWGVLGIVLAELVHRVSSRTASPDRTLSDAVS